jgi:hypothetical protein
MSRAILLSFFLMSIRLFGQNIIVSGGEYMDTTSITGVKCKGDPSYFYQVDGKYPENSASLLKDVRSYLLNTRQTYSGSGYITFQFTVDCEGKVMKRIKVLQTDENYIQVHFDQPFITALFSFFKTLNKWKIARSEDGEPISYYAFITFKIQNGKVINIIP